ncbi:biotin--protein ligase isoform X2 [Dunckerocampus dactyliophorus]|uniref:biotin--protein ligase isoform X2 n=1 Tax=Dunckerocampus dactyliophorus TaxID=161453 RepID=UPI0024062BD0|nr:biotin--protein ligase isoform X2 [Dunckerocampus dactyliophorus]
MFITLCYMYLWVRFHKCYSVLIRSRLSALKSDRSLSFIRSASVSAIPPRRQNPLSPEDNIFLQLGDKAVTLTDLQVCDDLITWTVLPGASVVCGPQRENISFIIEAVGHSGAHNISNEKVLKWSDACIPLACSPSQPFRAVAQASVDDFSRLGVAFLEDRLQLDKGLVPSKIVPIVLHESTVSDLIQRPEDAIMLCHTHPVNEKKSEERGAGQSCVTHDEGPDSDEHMDSHGHHLHLSSCHECLELENSTILSVKYASAENISDYDSPLHVDSGDDALDDFEHDVKSFMSKSCVSDHDNKLPNVLVYTNGSKERFHAVQQVLSKCLNMEKYTIYSLEPQQALSEPWMDNTRLLVLAEEEALTPQLHTQFLNYLSQGGRVLGLASSLCPAGLSLEKRDDLYGQLHRLCFTREDNTELEVSVLASGKVFVRDVPGRVKLELWGELKDGPHQKDAVIIRITHGEHGGEAVMCQVHLEKCPATEDLADLQINSAIHYQILEEILTSLGFSCQQNQTPAPSPVYLLATSQEAKEKFLQWLNTHANQNGLVTMSKAILRIAPSSELHNCALQHDRSLFLLTDYPEPQIWEHFCLETYRSNLKTSRLGHTMLYADVVSSTMDLIEGLNLHLPEDAGLILIAGQQSQGRGRGKNAWLSPVGCAMFTLCVQVKLCSRLGQKISFLQHLVALAVIEAVRTLPGYQDIDLRVKWPNDIYYSNLVKLGGVLVTSTVMGATFHLLIGCGFNVSNSDPTACINDLIQQYNIQHNCNLQPLSCAQLIARTVSCLEALMDRFQQGGPEAVLPMYYKRWLHSGAQVRLWSEDGLEAEVVGLDSNGFLQVHSKEQGIVSVESDGNSFDMMKNLVVIKQH